MKDRPSGISSLRGEAEEGSATSSPLGGESISEQHADGCGLSAIPEAGSGLHARGERPSSEKIPGGDSSQRGGPSVSAVPGSEWAVPEATPLESPSAVRSRVETACKRLQAAQNADSPGNEGSPLDKLGKPRQGGGESGSDHAPDWEESDLEAAVETMRKRARSKYITRGVVEELKELDSPVPYDRADHCCERIEQRDQKLTSNYCRCRWCIICNRIRAGVRINRYVPVFEDWDREASVQFVTLTVPNCEGEDLRETLDEMLHQLKLCRRQIRRTRGLEYKSVRSIEVTYNPEADTYHPHFHIAVCGRVQAIAVRDEWLKRWPEADRRAQDVQKWDGDPGSLKELVKYPTKLMTTAEGKEQPPAEALDRIFRVLKGRHLFEPVGFEVADYHEDLDPTVDLDEFEDREATIPAFSDPEENRIWMWDETTADWVDEETGECLTGFDPTVLDRAAARGDPSERSTSGSASASAVRYARVRSVESPT